MSAFTTAELLVTPHTANQWRVAEEFEWYIGVSRELAITVIKVPKGFITDFDSTPWIARVFLWFLLRGRHRGRRAATLHDFCYQRDPLAYLGYTKEDYDNIYLEAMIAEKVPEKTARRMRRALDTFISQNIWDDYRSKCDDV